MEGVLTKPIDFDLLMQTLIGFLPSSEQTKSQFKQNTAKNTKGQADREIQDKLYATIDELSNESRQAFLQTTLHYLQDSKKELATTPKR